jgi:PAS domain S-box-containing protein
MPSDSGPTLNSSDLEPNKTALIEKELELNLLAGNLPAVLFKAAPDGSIVFINQKGIEYTGRTLEDLQQKGWIDLIHPDDFEETSRHWNRLLTESVGYDTVSRFIAPTVNPDGFTSALPLSAMKTERSSRLTESCSIRPPRSGGTRSPTI